MPASPVFASLRTALAALLLPLLTTPLRAGVPTAEVLRPPAWLQDQPRRQAPVRPTELDLLLLRVAQGDQQWLPQARRLADGSLQIRVRRFPGDPPLAITDLQAMVRRPPSWERERLVIRTLLTRLERLGVVVRFEPLIRPEASGQWQPERLRLSLHPDLPDQGSRLVAQVLNHEAIHVAQSCAAGGLTQRPRPLGLPGRLAPSQQRLLDHPLYRQRPAAVRQVEAEAFAHQANLSLALALLQRYCLPGARSPGRLAA